MNRSSVYCSLSILTIIIFTACTTAQKPLDQYTNDYNEFIDKNYGNIQDNNFGYMERYSGYGYRGIINDFEQYENLFGKTELENRLQNISGIEDVVVVIDGNTAYCGINSNQNNNDLDDIKRQVSSQIKDLYPSITNIYVTTDKASIENMRYRTNNTNIMNGDGSYLFR